MKPVVQYLGHIVSKKGLQPDPEKARVVEQFPIPKDAGQLRPFLGIAKYYRRFILSFSQVAAPLFALLKKGNMNSWDEESQVAFERLPRMLCTAWPCLDLMSL